MVNSVWLLEIQRLKKLFQYISCSKNHIDIWTINVFSLTGCLNLLGSNIKFCLLAFVIFYQSQLMHMLKFVRLQTEIIL